MTLARRPLLAIVLTLGGLQLLALSLPTQAAPAAWYLWQSKVTGHYICRQWPPGEGWVRHSGPYADGGCRQAIKPPATPLKSV